MVGEPAVAQRGTRGLSRLRGRSAQSLLGRVRQTFVRTHGAPAHDHPEDGRRHAGQHDERSEHSPTGRIHVHVRNDTPRYGSRSTDGSIRSRVPKSSAGRRVCAGSGGNGLRDRSTGGAGNRSGAPPHATQASGDRRIDLSHGGVVAGRKGIVGQLDPHAPLAEAAGSCVF